jgi:glucosamine-phosphate N-acetyltransferase
VAHVEGILISLQYRNRGIGKKLMEILIDISKQKMCYKTILSCDESAEKFYQKCGFVKHGITMMISFE